MITQQQVAERLLWPLWRCVSDDYKKRYARDVWDHFENAVRSASYTGNLRTYLSNFQARIPVDLQAQYLKSIVSVVESGADDDILDWLRDDTTYLCMIVRLLNQDRKEAMADTPPAGFSPPGIPIDDDFSDLIQSNSISHQSHSISHQSDSI